MTAEAQRDSHMAAERRMVQAEGPLGTPEQFSDTQFFRRTLFVSAMTIATALVLALIWYASDVFLLMFAGILFAVLLRTPANWLARRTLLSQNVALALSVLALAAVLGLLIYLFAAPLAEQVGQLTETLPRAAVRMRQWVRQYRWGAALQPLIQELTRMKLDFQTLGQARGVISSTFAGLGGLVVALFLGVYLAAQPRLYQHGFLHLLPKRMRPRASNVLNEIGNVLRWWLVGRLIIMTVIGVVAGIGLWWLDVPLALTLGVLSGLLEFIPYLGPILSAVPALLIAFNLDPAKAFYVLLLYAVIQSAEGYLLSPLVEQRTVSLPPALVIFSTLLLAALAGLPGVMLASPLTAACIVAIKLLYVENVVEQPVK